MQKAAGALLSLNKTAFMTVWFQGNALHATACLHFFHMFKFELCECTGACCTPLMHCQQPAAQNITTLTCMM